MKKYIFTILAGLLISSSVVSQDVSDAGIWSSSDDSFQGFNFVPVGKTVFANESLIVFWYTYDESGNQVWFISDNVEANPSGNYQRVDIFNPICSFRVLSDECSAGDPVGVIDISKELTGTFDVRFAIDESVGDFSAECDPNVLDPRVSPAPPELPEEFECQGELTLERITPKAVLD